MKNPNEKILFSNLGENIIFIVIDPQLLKDILLKNNSNLIANNFFPTNSLIGDKNIIFSGGEDWKKRRKIDSFCFNHQNLVENVKIISRKVEKYIINIKNNEEKSSILNKVFIDIIGEFTLKLMLGLELNEIMFKKKNISERVHKFSEIINNRVCKIPFIIFGCEYYNKVKIGKEGRKTNKMIETRKIITNHILENKLKNKTNKKEENEGEISFIEKMIKLKYEDDQYKDINLTDEFLTILITAIDTTSALTLFVLINLLRNPLILSKLTEEINLKIKCEDDYNYENINNLIYLDAIINETLRICHPAPLGIAKKSITNIELGDYKFKKDSFFFQYFYGNMLNSKYYDDPYIFKPERWINENNGRKKECHEFTFLPFSAGPRNCIGQNFAKIETKIIIIKFLKNFDITLKTIKWGMILKTAYVPDIDILFQLKRK